MRSRPAKWAAPIGTLAVAAAATIGVMKWRRDRRTPQSRAKRAWRSMTKRFSR
jgi:O-antigen/teichoic acid export membrane protein